MDINFNNGRCLIARCVPLLLLIGFLQTSVVASAPKALLQQQVSGRVTDSLSQPLEGVSVNLKGGQASAVTDGDGRFVINVPSGDATLVFTFIGYANQEIAVQGRSAINVTMVEESSELGEVVVVGYGTQRRGDVTGSIVSVSAEEIEARPVNNVLEAMQGKAAGVDITSSQRPGTLGAITVRGVRSLSAANSPLYVVDGIPLTTDGIDNINPLDIEAIDILKDASATAIYGSRGANGVVIVTTKQGKAGRFTIGFNYSATIENLVDLAPMMNAAEYITFKRWAWHYQDPETYPRGDEPTRDNDYIIFLGSQDPSAFANLERGWEGGTWDASKVVSRDWTDYVTQQGVSNQYSLNVNGGSDKVKAYGSFGYLDNKGTVMGQRFRRFTGKVSVDITPVDWFAFGGSINGSHGIIDYGQSDAGRNSITNGGGLYESAKTIPAFTVPYDEEGNRIIYPGGDDIVKTVIDELKYSDEERLSSRLFGSFYAQVDFSNLSPALEGLKYRVNFGPELTFNRTGLYLDANSVVRAGSSYASLTKRQRLAYTLDNLVLYNRTFAERHDVGVTLLQSQTQFRHEQNNMAANNVPYADQLWNALTPANVVLSSYGSELQERQLLSYMGRVNYTFDERYSLTVSGRYDGASQLAEGNKWAFFPSAAAGWSINKESFLADATWINQLKLRLGVGVTGNSAIDPYATKGGLSSIFYPNGGALVPGTAPSTTLANQDLTWEKTTQYNLGLDFALANYRLSGALDFYTSRTNDLLLEQEIASVTGYTLTWANVGATKSSGIDLTLNSINFDTERFKWNTTLNASLQTNEITELANGVKSDLVNNWFVGEQLGVIYGYRAAGIWKPGDEAEMARFNENGHSFEAGQTRPVDLNGDYRIDANNDREIIGNTMPKYIVGLTNRFDYRNFDLSIFIYGRLGYQYSTGGEHMGARSNQRRVDYYTAAHTNSEWQRPEWTAGTADPYYQALGYRSGSFLKIRNISLGYTLPPSLASKLKVNNLRVYVQALNPGTIFSEVDWVDLDVDARYFNRGFTAGINFDL